MNDFNDILKNKLEDFREAPSQDVFNNIRSNYPKRTFLDFLNNNKYYFIAVASAVLITTAIIILSSSVNTPESKNNFTQEDINTEINDNAEVTVITQNDAAENSLKTNSVNYNVASDNLSVMDNPDVRGITAINVFNSDDTLVCGSVYETTIKGSVENLIIPAGLKLISLNDRLRIICSKAGNYKILYSEENNRKVLSDSMTISFNNLLPADVSISKENLCPEEDITLVIKNTNVIPDWTSRDLNFRQLSTGKYIVSGFVPGKNILSFMLSDNSCKTEYTREINVSETPDYKYISTPNVCGGANASLTIKCGNSAPVSYILNNELISKDGRFTNLNSGIYYLSINYGYGCRLNDTLLIRDSLNISPFFISERDLVNKNKYYFRNLTNVDDYGYERNQNIEFIWKVNGEELPHSDNPTYEFTDEGNNVVELIAILSETCRSTYSETILISGSNFRIPNIFTPNGDGIGDEYKVVYEGNLANYEITIINRLGETVYETNDINHSWDGKINGNNDASEGLYYYIIRGEDKFGNKIEQKGGLQLVRH